MNLSEQISEKILQLQESLLSQHPQMPTLLRDIHKTLKDNPDCVTLLEESEVAIIVEGLKKQTATEIATATIKAKSTRALKSLTLADL